MTKRTRHTSMKDHPNYNAVDLAYLREKGYSDDEIAAIWGRDADRGQGPQTHANGPGSRRKTTMLLLLRAFQAADSHVPHDSRERYEAMLKAQGIDDIDTLIHEFIELMNATC